MMIDDAGCDLTLDAAAVGHRLLQVLRHHIYGEQLDDDPVSALSSRLRALSASAFAVPAVTGTAALQIALHAVGVTAGNEVIIPANTCAAVAMAVMQLGAVPVLADVDDSMTVSPASVACRVTERTRAAIVVHQYGIVADAAGVRGRLAPGIAVIEDCAQAIGASAGGEPVGSHGDASIYSFCHGKIVSAGQGGMMTTQHADVARRAARYTRLGADVPPVSLELGHNFELSPLVALAALVQLDRLGDLLAARDALAARYRGRLIDHGFRPCQTSVPGARSVCHRQVVLAPLSGSTYRRWIEQLRARGTRMQPAHPQPLYRAPFLRDVYARTRWATLIDDPERWLPGALARDDRALFLYVGPDMSGPRVDSVCDDLIAALRGRA